jgi:cytochrome c oxidase cbb3-type subunit II
MKMTPAMVVIGSFLIFWASMYIMVIMPAMSMKVEPSEIWRPWDSNEQAGHKLYVANGCSYCHSQFIRIQDWDRGAQRIALAGDYVGQEPAILGTERTGPDLSQEGGERPNDWHIAHFINPRNTSPISLMPSWEFLGQKNIRQLTAYVQAEGGKNADIRVERQINWKKLAIEAYNAGPDKNIAWLHSNIPAVWRNMPNPYPADEADLLRGKKMYQEFCISCHGPIGDGQMPAAKYLEPVPLNFTTLKRNLVDGKYIGGILYYQIMNGITGTAMPYFKRDLESDKIWAISNYVAVNFIGYTDAGIEPKGIESSYQLPWKNPYQPGSEKEPNK